MTEEAYVSFEVAKLLKEKGFNERSKKIYKPNGKSKTLGWYATNSILSEHYHLSCCCTMPTQQVAMRWLREMYKMYVCIGIKCFMPHLGKIDGYSACIWYKPENNEGICCYWAYPPKQQEAWDTYEAATEAAIKYCLENLIKEE